MVVYASDPIKKVIGEFQVGEILYDELHALWAKTGEQAGIAKERFLEYFTNKAKGYAIKVEEARKYENPLALHQFMLSWPPQSFTYL